MRHSVRLNSFLCVSSLKNKYNPNIGYTSCFALNQNMILNVLFVSHAPPIFIITDSLNFEAVQVGLRFNETSLSPVLNSLAWKNL